MYSYGTRKPKLNTIYFGELGENTYNSAICTTFGESFDNPLTLFGRGLQKLGQFLIPTLWIHWSKFLAVFKTLFEASRHCKLQPDASGLWSWTPRRSWDRSRVSRGCGSPSRSSWRSAKISGSDLLLLWWRHRIYRWFGGSAVFTAFFHFFFFFFVPSAVYPHQ